jgi:Sec-independent protein translocase protein TatA
MSLSLRQRCQAVAECIHNQGMQGLQAIANATGQTLSSVYRHQQAISRRNQQAESLWWETPVGSQWLKVLVLGVVYYFGIKHGVGSEGLSEFFKAVHLNHHVGTSASSLRKLKQQMRDAIEAYKAAQEEHCQPREGQGICTSADETFFDLPLLVLLELASGYILTEVKAENRTYDTWNGQIQQWWATAGWKCHFMVSDGAPALIKLALSGLGCVSVADLFHALRALAQPIGSAIGRQVSQLNKKAQTLQEQYAKASNEAKRHELQQSMDALLAQQQGLEEAKTTYHQAIHSITQAIHPFHISNLQWQLFHELSSHLSAPLQQLSTLAHSYGGDKATQAIDTFEQQISSMAQGIHAWWQWVNQALAMKTDQLDVQQWVLMVLLPWAYWQQQADKTRHPILKKKYQQAANRAYELLAAHAISQQMAVEQGQQWIEWAQWMCTKYQRTSSAVEGRNGYLSGLHHLGRGLTAQTLKVLTIIHNFDLKRADGTTAAQRLFDHRFPDLFEWVVDHMGELPVARHSSKAQQANPLPLGLFSA